MNKSDLQIIINGFDASTEKEGAFFGIYQYGNATDESCIKANKKGLELFASELLKVAKDADVVLANGQQPRFPIDYLQDWFDIKADTFIQYIEIVDVSTQNELQSTYKLSKKDKLIPILFILLGLIILFLLIVGIYATVKWLF